MSNSLKNRTTYILGSLFLASGISLLIFIGTGISMGVTLIGCLLLFSMIGGLLWHRLPPSRKAFLKLRASAGLKAGIIATLAYDVARFILIKLTGIHFWPFDIFRIFGRALVGSEIDPVLTQLAGLGFHLLNGTAFGVAYTIWFATKGIGWGIGYALALEALMVSVYPGWLGLKALDEFLQVSIFGHLIYGIVLGYLAQRWTGLTFNSLRE